MTLCFQCCHRLRRLWLSPPLHDPALKRRIHLARLGRCRPHHQRLRPHPSLPPFHHTRQVQEHQVRARHPQQAGLPHCRLLQHCALCRSHLTVHLPRHRRRLQVGSPFPLLLLHTADADKDTSLVTLPACSYAPVIWFSACLAGWASWMFIPAENWLKQDLIVVRSVPSFPLKPAREFVLTDLDSFLQHMDDGANKEFDD